MRYVVEGGVRKSGNRVRITAQLIDGMSGGHLWAERYDRDLTDIFALQNELTEKIVAALQVTLTERKQEQVLICTSPVPEPSGKEKGTHWSP